MILAQILGNWGIGEFVAETVQVLSLVLAVWPCGFPRAFPLMVEISLAFGEDDGRRLVCGL